MVLPNTLAAPSVSVCPRVSGKRPWDYDSQLEQEQREGDEVQDRSGYQQPLPLSLFRQRPPIEHDKHRRVEAITNSPSEEAMISKTTGSMPVRIMIEPTVILLVLFFRAHGGALGAKSSWLGPSTLGEGVTSNIRSSQEVQVATC